MEHRDFRLMPEDPYKAAARKFIRPINDASAKLMRLIVNRVNATPEQPTKPPQGE